MGYLGCNDSWVDSPSPLPADCANTRGNIFDTSTSSTWQPKDAIDTWGLKVEDYVGNNISAYFGFDQIYAGFTPTGVGLSNSTVAWFKDENFAVGMLGLNYRPTNFTTAYDRSSALLTLLYEQKLIPSLSYGYTAGAFYRGKDSGFSFGSLVLGGYDKLKIQPNDVKFLFGGDISKDLTVGVQTITALQNSQEVSLLPTAANFFIDSTTSQIWLPQEACALFEKAFGLVYDNSSGLYLINDTHHDILVAQNSSITFTLTVDIRRSDAIVEITLPYAAFDLWVNWGYNITQPSRYFPIRQANGTQYTLGRTFLQEAYLYVDNTAQTFTVSQRAWHTSNPSSLILPAAQNYISSAIIAAIAVSICVPLAITAFSVWFFLRRKRIATQKRKAEEEVEAAQRAREKEEAIVPDPFATPDGVIGELHAEKPETPELFGRLLPFNGQEVDGTHASELRYELGRGMEGIEGRHELEAPHGISQAPASVSEDRSSESEGSMKSVDIGVSQPTETEGSTQGEIGSSIDPVSPESSGGSSRGLLEGDDPVSPQSPAPVKLQNDRHLVYGFF